MRGMVEKMEEEKSNFGVIVDMLLVKFIDWVLGVWERGI